MTETDKKTSELGVVLIPTRCGRIHKVGIRTVHLLGFAFFVSVSLLSIADSAPRWAERAYSALTDQESEISTDKPPRERAGFLSELSRLRAERAKVQDLKAGLQARLDSFLSLLESATTLAPTELADDVNNEAVAVEKGVGGIETEPTKEEEKLLQNSSLESMAPADDVEQAFLDNFDSFLSILKVVPIGTPADGGVNSPYGVRKSPFTGRWTHHTGVDIALPWGSEVRSTGEGIVKDVQRHPDYGLYVDIAHGNRIVTRFAHLSKAFVTPGDRVERGDLIALVGTTGRSTGPHLHYEIRIDGKPINPEKLLRVADSLPS